MAWEDLVIGSLTAIGVGVSTYILIRYTRETARDIAQQAEKKKDLEKKRAELQKEVEMLKGVLASKEDELARLKNQLKEEKDQEDARNQQLAAIVKELDEVLARLTQEEEKEEETRKEMRRKAMREE